jgi:hypothetical protein
VTGWWFSPGPPVSSTKTDRYDITEINDMKSIAVNGTGKYRQCFCVNVSNKLKKKSFFEEPDTTFSSFFF